MDGHAEEGNLQVRLRSPQGDHEGQLQGHVARANRPGFSARIGGDTRTWEGFHETNRACAYRNRAGRSHVPRVCSGIDAQADRHRWAWLHDHPQEGHGEGEDAEGGQIHLRDHRQGIDPQLHDRAGEGRPEDREDADRHVVPGEEDGDDDPEDRELEVLLLDSRVASVRLLQSYELTGSSSIWPPSIRKAARSSFWIEYTR